MRRRSATRRSPPQSLSIAQDWLDLDAERGPSSFDQRHLVTAQFQYTTGVGDRGRHARRRRWGALFKDWTITSQLTAGQRPAVHADFFTSVAGTGVVGVRPSLTGVSTDRAAPGTYANPAAFTAPAAGPVGRRRTQLDSRSGAVRARREPGARRSGCAAASSSIGGSTRPTCSIASRSRRQHHRRESAVRPADDSQSDARAADVAAAEVLTCASLHASRSSCCRASPAQAAAAAAADFRRDAADRPDRERQGQGRQADRGLTAKDFVVTEDGGRRRLLRRVSSRSRRRRRPSAGMPPRRRAGTRRSRRKPSRCPSPGDTRYRGRRLLILYFDLYGMPPSDQIARYDSAAKYIDTQMTPADLVAIMVVQGTRRAGEAGLHRRPRGAAQRHPGPGGRRGDRRRRHRTSTWDPGGAFGEDDDAFNIFTTDRQLSALQTAVTISRPLPEQKTLIYFASGLRLNGTDNQAQLRATVNAAIRANVTINPIDARGLVATAAARRRDARVARRHRDVLGRRWPRMRRRDSSGRRTRSTRWRRTRAARRCSTTTISRSASCRRRRR